MANKYTYSQIGERIMQRNPESFSGLPYTPEQVGRRIVDRNPELQNILAGPEVEQTPVEQPVEKQNIFKKVGSALISSETGLANTIGGAISTLTPEYKAAQKSQIALDDLNVKLGKAIIEQKKLGKDTTRMERLYQSNTGRVFNPSEITGGAIDKTTGQVLGEAAGVGLDIATAGTYGKLASGAKTGQLLTKSPTVAKIAGKAGITVTKPLAAKEAVPTVISNLGKKELAKSVATGAGIGYGYDVAGKLQSGETGAGAFTPGLGTAIGGALPLAAKGLQKTGIFSGKASKRAESLKNVEDEIANIESNYAKTRPLVDKNQGARRLVAESNVLSGSVDNTGTISTKLKGGAIDKFRESTIDGIEGVVRKGLQSEGISISPNAVKEQLRKSILESNLEGAELKRALSKIDDEVDGLALKSNDAGNIKLENLQDAKVFTYQNVDYNKPASKLESKAFANGYKTLIENNSRLNIGEVNKELGKYYDAIDLLESLDGRKVKGGKLGKYSAKLGGQLVGLATGGAVGGFPGMAIGTIAGGEMSAKIQGMLMSKTFGKGVEGGIKKSAILEKAASEYPQARKLLPERASVKESEAIALPERMPRVSTLGTQVKPKTVEPIKEFEKSPVVEKKSNIGKKVNLGKSPNNPEQSLIQEARKYKSAEEFVKAQMGKTDLPELKNISDKNKYAEKLGFNVDKETLEVTEDFWAKESTPNQYYHIGEEMITEFDKSKSRFNPKIRGGGISQINGMYLGRDPEALSNFYGMILKDEMGKTPTMSSFKMAPKWLDLSHKTDETKFLKEVSQKYRIKQGRTAEFGDALEKEIVSRGYDGVRYFDPYATGEEFVLVKKPPTKSQLTDIWNKANKNYTARQVIEGKKT